MKHIIPSLLLVTSISVTISQANEISTKNISNKMGKLENILRTHESVISGLMDDKAEQIDLNTLKKSIAKIQQDIQNIYLLIKKPKKKEEISYDSKYDAKFKAYLDKRKTK